MHVYTSKFNKKPTQFALSVQQLKFKKVPKRY
jgi:hypothetical protein